jgi:hypothetical protein
VALKGRVVAVGALRPKLSIDDELEWFFNRAEGDMGLQSNFIDALEAEYERAFEGHLEAARRHREIRDRLRSIADSDAGVLQVAYEQRDWPEILVRRFGRLTGVIVRLACALDHWPSDRPAQQVVERARAEWLVPECAAGVGKTLGRLCNEAGARFSRASSAYEATRRPR